MAPGDMEMLARHAPKQPRYPGAHAVGQKQIREARPAGSGRGEIDPSLPAWVVVNTLFSLQRIIGNPFARDEPQRSEAEIAAAIESIIHFFKQGIAGPCPCPWLLNHRH